MEEGTINLRDLVRILKRRRILIFNIIFVAIILSLVLSFLIPPTYEAETSLRVKRTKSLANSLLAEAPGNPDNMQLMSTYAEILKSRTVVQAVIDKTQVGNSSKPKYEEMLGMITTQPVKDTEILKVKVKAGSPEDAQLIANTLVESFNDRLTYLARSEQKGIREFIGQRVKESKLELDKAESTLEEYQRNEQIMAPADETKAILERMSNVKKLVNENAVNMGEAQARYYAAVNQLEAEKPSSIADSPLIQQYKGKLADMEIELVGLSQNYGKFHPRIQALQASIEEIRRKLNDEVARVINNEAPSFNPIHLGLMQSLVQADAEMAARQAQKAALIQIMDQSEEELKRLPAKEQGITRLMREVMVTQEIYVMLAKRYEEARINEFMQPTDVQIIDTAIAQQQPITPTRTFDIAIGVLVGLLLGIFAALVKEYAHLTIYNSQDAKRLLGLPVLGTVPDFSSAYDSTESKYAKKVLV